MEFDEGEENNFNKFFNEIEDKIIFDFVKNNKDIIINKKFDSYNNKVCFEGYEELFLVTSKIINNKEFKNYDVSLTFNPPSFTSVCFSHKNVKKDEEKEAEDEKIKIKIEQNFYYLKNQIDFVKNLSENDKKLLYNYTFKYDAYTNALHSAYYPFKMKRTDEKFKIGKEISLLMDRLFLEVPKTNREITVFRGASDIFHGPYVSTTLDKNSVLGFSLDKNIYKIIIPKGSSILPLFPISHFGHEAEILLDRKKILKKTERECKIRIYKKMHDCIELIYS